MSQSDVPGTPNLAIDNPAEIRESLAKKAIQRTVWIVVVDRQGIVGLPMTAIADEITTHLQPFVGLKLSIARRAADLCGFHFGQVREVEKGTRGDYALHIQCAWRFEGPDAIITGRSDLWEPAEDAPDIDWDTWDCDENENLQDKLVGELLGSYDPQTGSFINETDQLVVEAVRGDAYGGATLVLSGGFRLVIFPAGSCGEDWRIFRPRVEESHFVIAGGKVETHT